MPAWDVLDSLRKATGVNELEARKLFEGSIAKYRPGWILCASRNRGVCYVDEELAARMGYLKSELYGRDFHVLFPENVELLEKHAGLYDSWWASEDLNGPEDGVVNPVRSCPMSFREIAIRRDQDLQIRFKDGSLHKVGVRVGPIELPDGQTDKGTPKHRILAAAGIILQEDYA